MTVCVIKTTILQNILTKYAKSFPKGGFPAKNKLLTFEQEKFGYLIHPIPCFSQVPAPPSRKNRWDHCNQWQPEGLCWHFRHLAQDHSWKVIFFDIITQFSHTFPLPNMPAESPASPPSDTYWGDYVCTVHCFCQHFVEQSRTYKLNQKNVNSPEESKLHQMKMTEER